MKILHPSDFSKTAEKARLLAIDLRGRLKADLHITHVQEKFEDGNAHPYLLASRDQLSPELLKRLDEERADETRRLREQLAAITPSGASHELRWGGVLSELLEMLPDHDLVVMGAHGANRLDNFFLGGTAGRLVRRSPVPVLTVRSESESQQVNRILVATDFGRASRYAWDYCRKLAESGIKLTVAHVVDKPLGLLRTERPKESTQEIVSKLEALTDDTPAQHVIREGDPVKVLPQIAAELGADAIAIGIEHHSSAVGLLFASQADALLRSSPVPILSIPFEADQD